MRIRLQKQSPIGGHRPPQEPPEAAPAMIIIWCIRRRSTSFFSMPTQLATTSASTASRARLPFAPVHRDRSTASLPPFPAALRPVPSVLVPGPRTSWATRAVA
ncbi:uncharacterized protein GLRG_07367 [Colletotrichum graminicola M1.001]|uniref:Uncharacterized protein n=1 Tax=Colletotrichum graminicola (strain M1.001 / M2 / FGSC 10212) TaxID=645133 RepID=E3QMY5_COLGM|nr:uncharacterized protein GLRG_07367 [Colletotrichum graminicola M1.001]EFQ32223.1 hypothetical protein GLRG_07367 [Colletotrichum graminicola M1.001]